MGVHVRVLRDATGFTELPLHLAYRLHAVLGDREVLWADSDVEVHRPAEGPATLAGRVVVFTSVAVLVLVLDGTALRPGPDDATVAVDVWSRRALRGVRLDAADNSHPAWETAWGTPWPRGARVRLAYDGRDDLVLPLSGGAAGGLAELLPLLVDDLGR